VSKQEYKIFKNNDGESVSEWFQECEEKRIVNLWGVRKRLYTNIQWDYYSLTKYLQFENLNNCSYREEIEELYAEYLKNNSLPKDKEVTNFQEGVGSFYVKNEDAVVVLEKINKIFQDMLASDCMNAKAIEDVVFPKKMLEVIGIKNSRD